MNLNSVVCSVINQLVIVRQFHENCYRLAFIVTIGQMIVSFHLIDYYYQFIFCYILGWTFHFVLWISQYSSMHYLQNPLIQYALGVLYIKQYKLLTLGTESWFSELDIHFLNANKPPKNISLGDCASSEYPCYSLLILIFQVVTESVLENARILIMHLVWAIIPDM